MERLTEIVVDSFGKTRAVLIEPTKWSACANCNSRNNCDDCSLQKAVSKLSTIEDILGDDCDLDRLRVIVNQRMSMRDEVAKRFEITKNIPLDRLRELVEADREGRCTVLPSIYEAALNKWGKENQTRMMFEEMAELQKELCKEARGEDNTDAIAEEIADVKIMLEQMTILHGCKDTVEMQMERKLQRLKERLEGE